SRSGGGKRPSRRAFRRAHRRCRGRPTLWCGAVLTARRARGTGQCAGVRVRPRVDFGARDGAERERELLGERVDELASRIAGQEARAHDAAAVRALLADARECADQDRAETERVTESLRLEIGSLSGRLNELSGLRAAEMQETRRLRDDLSARLDELTARIGGQERHDAAVDTGAEDEAELWETRAFSAEDGVPAKQKPGKKRKKKHKR